MYTGPTGSHSDAAAPRGAPNSGEYDVPTSFDEYKKKDGYDSDTKGNHGNEPDGRKYGSIEERSWGSLFTSPVDTVETLKSRTALTAQFHHGNREHWEDETRYQNNGGALYDLMILDVCEAKLAEEGIDVSNGFETGEVSERRMRAVFLRAAREQNGQEFHEHLTGSDHVSVDVHQALGYDAPRAVESYDTLQRSYRDLKRGETVQWDDFEAAVTRAVYAVVRAGVVAPDSVMETYGFDVLEPPLNETAVSRATEKQEIRRSIKKLAERTLDPIGFNRESKQTSHEILAFIAACAGSAETDKGLEEVKDICDWHYPRAAIPGGGWTRNYITERLALDGNSTFSDHQPNAGDPWSPVIDDQFDAVRRRTLNVAGDLGFWDGDESVDIAFDIFRLDWTGDSLEVTVGRPAKKENDNVTEEWTFVTGVCIDTERRFALGARLLKSKSDYPAAVHDILSNAAESIDIGTVLFDKESVSGELIENLQEFEDAEWIISAPNKPIIKGLKRLTPKGHAGFADGVTWNTDLKLNVVTHPTSGPCSKTVGIDPENVATEKIRGNTGDKIRVPLKNSTVPSGFFTDDEFATWLRFLYADLESQPGIGNEKHAAYFTNRSIPEQSASGVRFDYIPRWSIEDAIGRMINNFLPVTESSDPNQRLFSVHVAVLLYNWYILINRSLSPHFIRLDVCESQLRKAVQDVGFSPVDTDAG